MTASKPTHITRAPKDKANPYFMYHRATAQDESLSWAARGVLAYLLSKPDDWQVKCSDLQQGCKREKAYSILDELEKARYLTREPEQSHLENGKFGPFIYHVHEIPCAELTDTVSTITEKPTLTYKRESQTTESTENTLSQTAGAVATEGSVTPEEFMKHLENAAQGKPILQVEFNSPLQSSAKVSPFGQPYMPPRDLVDALTAGPPTPINGNGDTKNIPAAATPATVQKAEVPPEPSTNRAASNGTSVLLPDGYEWRGIGGQKHLVRESYADKPDPHPVLMCGAKYDGLIVTGPDFSLFTPCLDCLEKAKPRPPRKRSAWDDTFDALIAGMLGKSTFDLTPADKAAKGGIVGPWLHGKRNDKDCGGLLAYEVARTGRDKAALDYAELATAAELFWQWYRRNDKTRALTACATFLSNWADFRDNKPSPKDYEHGANGTRNDNGNAGLLAQGKPGGDSVHYPGHKVLRD